MNLLAFTTPLTITTKSLFHGKSTESRATTQKNDFKMSLADQFMFKSQTKEAKQAATPYGVYTVQCTEGTGGANTAEATRLAVLAKQFRLRQTSISEKYSDLYSTRRAAIIAAQGSHKDETYAIQFPSRAAAGILGRSEQLGACSRYFSEQDLASEYMFECVEKQYKAMRVPNGEYSTSCCDGRQSGDADTARISSLATTYRANHLSKKQKTQMRYNASLEAIYSGRGCSYEEESYLKFPKMAGAIRWSTGAYAASKGGATAASGGALMSVTEQIEGVNLDAYWPSYKIRPAVKRDRAPWESSGIKNYSAMSQAAMDYGIKAQTERYTESGYEGWTSGWKTTSTLLRQASN